MQQPSERNAGVIDRSALEFETRYYFDIPRRFNIPRDCTSRETRWKGGKENFQIGTLPGVDVGKRLSIEDLLGRFSPRASAVLKEQTSVTLCHL